MSKIAVIAGDGIGQEVIPAGIDVVKKAAAACGAAVTFTEFPWGCDFYLKTGRMMPEEGFDRLQAIRRSPTTSRCGS
jgi:tartrate dehydrogenase/decarboxylase/D-malate dehydrogenase